MVSNKNKFSREWTKLDHWSVFLTLQSFFIFCKKYSIKFSKIEFSIVSTYLITFIDFSLSLYCLHWLYILNRLIKEINKSKNYCYQISTSYKQQGSRKNSQVYKVTLWLSLILASSSNNLFQIILKFLQVFRRRAVTFFQKQASILFSFWSRIFSIIIDLGHWRSLSGSFFFISLIDITSLEFFAAILFSLKENK